MTDCTIYCTMFATCHHHSHWCSHMYAWMCSRLGLKAMCSLRSLHCAPRRNHTPTHASGPFSPKDFVCSWPMFRPKRARNNGDTTGCNGSAPPAQRASQRPLRPLPLKDVHAGLVALELPRRPAELETHCDCWCFHYWNYWSWRSSWTHAY